jgi:hypothetical protein
MNTIELLWAWKTVDAHLRSERNHRKNDQEAVYFWGFKNVAFLLTESELADFLLDVQTHGIESAIDTARRAYEEQQFATYVRGLGERAETMQFKPSTARGPQYQDDETPHSTSKQHHPEHQDALDPLQPAKGSYSARSHCNNVAEDVLTRRQAEGTVQAVQGAQTAHTAPSQANLDKAERRRAEAAERAQKREMFVYGSGERVEKGDEFWLTTGRDPAHYVVKKIDVDDVCVWADAVKRTHKGGVRTFRIMRWDLNRYRLGHRGAKRAQT